MQEEKIVDIKGTLEQFVKADEPEISQEEAIMKFGETKKKKFNNNDDTDTTEEQEHLQRIKQELLASLERVKKLEKQIYKEPDLNEKSKLKVKGSQKGGFSKENSLEERQIQQVQEESQKERE